MPRGPCLEDDSRVDSEGQGLPRSPEPGASGSAPWENYRDRTFQVRRSSTCHELRQQLRDRPLVKATGKSQENKPCLERASNKADADIERYQDPLLLVADVDYSLVWLRSPLGVCDMKNVMSEVA